MIQKATLIQLCEVLLQLAKLERQVELIRQMLCEQLQFVPYCCFKRIDLSLKNSISAEDIRQFLIEFNFNHPINACQLFIYQYDQDFDGFLSYSEFLRAILTLEKKKLRLTCSQRFPIKSQDVTVVPQDILYTLSWLLHLEIRSLVDIQQIKIDLNNRRDFNLDQAFLRVAYQNQKFITDQDIMIFFEQHGLKTYNEEIFALLRRLDVDNDGFVCFNDFQKSIICLPSHFKNMNKLQDSFNETKQQMMGNFQQSSNKKVSKQEQEQQANNQQDQVRLNPKVQNINYEQQNLSQPNKFDNNNSNALKKSDYRSAQKYTNQTMNSTFYQTPKQKNTSYIKIQSEKQKSKLKRDNSTPQKKLSYFEKNQGVTQLEDQCAISNDRHEKYLKLKSILRGKMATLQQQRSTSPNFNRSNSNSNKKKINKSMQQTTKLFYQTQQKDNNTYIATPEKNNIISFNNNNNLKNSQSFSVEKQQNIDRDIVPQKRNHSPIKKSLSFTIPIKKGTNYEIMQIMQQIIGYEKRLERVKQDLSLRPDFNLFDLFRYIDFEGQNSVGPRILSQFLQQFGLNYTILESSLLIQRFDKDGDGKWKFSEFCEAFTPNQQEYSSILKKRDPINGDLSLSLMELYSQETYKLIKLICKLFMETEIELEQTRQEFLKNKQIDYSDAFLALDTNSDGLISHQEIQIFFENNGQFYSDKEIQYFINRFDKDKDNCISFSEFLEELSPKSTRNVAF